MTLICLVTGASGQDGRFLCARLIREGCRVMGVVRPGSSGVLPMGVERIEMDLSVPGSMEAMVRSYPADQIFNLAAESFSPACESGAVAAADLLGRSVVELLGAALRFRPLARIFQASSSEMFGNPRQIPQNEDTPLNPISMYGAAKAFAHHVCLIHRERHGQYVSTGILYSHESPLRRESFLTKKVCRAVAAIAANRQAELHLGSMDAQRDWSYAGDIVAGIRATLQAPAPEDYILASGTSHTVGEFCERAFRRVGLDYRDFVRTDASLLRRESNILVGNPDRARRLLSWRKEMDFGRLVDFMVDFECGRLAGVDLPVPLGMGEMVSL